MVNKNKLLNLNNARKKTQRVTMERIIKDGVCPFCENNFTKYHTKPILFKTKYWIVTENAWPYECTKNHFLLVYRPKHLEKSIELEKEAYADFKEIIERLEKERGMEFGTLLMRFGDMSQTGATVKHIHAQLIQGDSKNPKYNPSKGVVTRIG